MVLEKQNKLGNTSLNYKSMIQNKQDLKFYLDADRLALGIPVQHFSIKKLLISTLFPDYRWKYQKLMRKIEYSVLAP